ncbi:MAG: fibronectin-binding protein [Cyanobacteria bacterium RYN_339]|nr:fibronectin-binding protein [Cyanobacteria bacterium RYN_339]
MACYHAVMAPNKMQFFDGSALAAVIAELNQLGECRIDKVGQASAGALYLNLRAGGRNHRLYLSVQEQWARLHLTRRNPPNVPVPSAFVMQLRKHLEGSRLLRVEQPGLERVARLVVAGRDELGDPFERILVAELIGKYANLFLVDAKDELVMGALRPITEEMCRVRQVMPGMPYDPPPVNRVDFLDAEDADFLAAFAAGGKLADRLSGAVSGLSKVAAGQLVAAIGCAPGVAVDELDGLDPVLDVLRRARRNVQAGLFHPRLDPTTGWDYAVWWLGDGAPPEGSASALIDDYYGGREERHLLEERRRKLTSEAAEHVRKQRERLAGWEEMLTKSETADRHRELGDLLTSHMYLLSPGMAEVAVTDFYHPEQAALTIPLDPRLTPSENVQRHFRRYQKARNSRQVVEGLLVEGRAEQAYLDQVATAVAQAPTPADLDEIAEELGAIAGKAPTQRRRGQPPPPAPAPLRFTSSDGLAIWVGKNNKQNEHVTFKLARSHDLWLHAQNIPGSHVVVQAEGDVPERTLHEAAMLAAWYSQARESSQVPVVYTRRKHVRKPRGGRPGMVIYDHERTLYVHPEQP